MRLHIFIVLYFCAFISRGQDVFYESIPVINALPSKNIYDIFRDTKGFLWLASQKGLARYNGINFKSYFIEEAYSSVGSLIKEDQEGRIWYETFDGYYFFVDTQKDSIYRLPTEESSSYKPYAIHKNFLFIVTDKGLEKINTQTFQSDVVYAKKDMLFVHNLGDAIFFGTSNEIFIYHFISQKIEKAYQLPNTFNSSIFILSESEIIITDRASLQPTFCVLKADSINCSFLELKAPLRNVYRVDNEYWLMTSLGIFSYDTTLKPSKRQHYFMKNKNVSSLTADKNGNVWVASPDEGLFVIENLNKIAYQLEQDKFSSISKKNNKIYTGTQSGKVLEHTEDLTTKLHFDTKEKHPIYYLNFNEYNAYNFFTGDGLYIQQKNKPIKKYLTAVKSICKVSDNEFAFAATGLAGLIVFQDLEKETLKATTALQKSIRAKAIATNQVKHILLATNKGLFLYKNNKRKEILYDKNRIFIEKIVTIQNSFFALDNRGRLFKVEDEQLSFYQFSPVFKSIKTYNNRLYMADANHLYFLENEKLKLLHSFRESDKIIDFEILNEQIFVITEDKLIKMPLSVPEMSNSQQPYIYIKSLLLNQQEHSIQEFSIIPHTVETLKIVYQLLNFNTGSFEYFYTINQKKYPLNIYKDTIYLPKLSDGVYEIGISIMEKSTKKIVAQGENIKFEIMPPIWKRNWFFALSSLLIALTASLIYYYKILKIRKLNREKIEKLSLENKLQDAKLQLIKSQMNPHFFFNAINNIQSFIITKEATLASKYLAKLSKLTRNILEFSERENITLSEEIETLSLYLELQKMRFKDLNYELKIDKALPMESLHIPTMLIQPYVENAIIHGLSHSDKPKKLMVEFYLNDKNILVCRISDNGIGRKKAQKIRQESSFKSNSFATKANFERIMLLNKSRYKININYTDIDTEAGTGTEVLISVEL
ncbi:MAG: histidine kinase [Thermonemataceae bacterium]|nr:histidine kinase [Thermonemataceae bacterium]